ncbi:CDP-alcohol phosphatidyltransferase [bacterium BMS3Bbin04]|nr:CDP-alcohol phosphatidyltransferase [bacterium BMS3Bbin04]
MYRITAMSFTVSNIISGLASLIFFRKRKYNLAVVSIVLASIFDVLDGWAARKSGSTGSRGRYLDSVADLTSFGIVPTLNLLSVSNSRIYRLVAALYSSAIVFRLIRFTYGTEVAGEFSGMPSPATALAVTGSTALAAKHSNLSWLAPLTTLVFSGLAVSKLRYGKITHPSIGVLPKAVTVLLFGGHFILLFFFPGISALSLMIIYAVLAPSVMSKFKRQHRNDAQGVS